MKIAIASDHAGFALKEKVKKFLANKKIQAKDLGTFSERPVDYPDYAKLAAKSVSLKKISGAVLICGTGQGMAMAANKFKGVRAAACESIYCAKMSRAHNDSNILCLGARILSFSKAMKITAVWLDTKFDGGRHLRRVRKIR
ncbi:MAG: ribose 5-phosphate isomerase B [Candidatus Margulisiibacteriota bacterium]